MMQSTADARALQTPEPAPPVGLDRYRQLGEIAPLPMHEVIHALLAAHLIRPVRLVGETREDELSHEVVGREILQLPEELAELAVGLGKRLRLRDEPLREDLADLLA